MILACHDAIDAFSFTSTWMDFVFIIIYDHVDGDVFLNFDLFNQVHVFRGNDAYNKD